MVAQEEEASAALSNVRGEKRQSSCPARAGACFVPHVTMVQTMSQMGPSAWAVVRRCAQGAARVKWADTQRS